MGRLFVVSEYKTDGTLGEFVRGDNPDEIGDELDLSEGDIDLMDEMDLGAELNVSDGKFVVRRES
jgi:hypothetical protein